MDWKRPEICVPASFPGSSRVECRVSCMLLYKLVKKNKAFSDAEFLNCWCPACDSLITLSQRSPLLINVLFRISGAAFILNPEKKMVQQLFFFFFLNSNIMSRCHAAEHTNFLYQQSVGCSYIPQPQVQHSRSLIHSFKIQCLQQRYKTNSLDKRCPGAILRILKDNKWICWKLFMAKSSPTSNRRSYWPECHSNNLTHCYALFASRLQTARRNLPLARGSEGLCVSRALY